MVTEDILDSDALNDSIMNGQTKVLVHSSFFQERRAEELPSPAKIRAINRKAGDFLATTLNRPPPVAIPSLGLLVKYGGDVTIVEAQTQVMVREALKEQVPVPEVFGWTRDGDQTFIYMSLIQGETLMVRWRTLEESERLTICKGFRSMVKLWRTIVQQDEPGPYIGSLEKLPLNEIFFRDRPELARPFHGPDAVIQLQQLCDIEIKIDVPILFTHADLIPPKILLTSGPNPKIAGIIDWGQSGWYPAYWEYCKTRWIRVLPEHMSTELQDEWYSKYLPMIMDEVDKEMVYHPWVFFALSKGI